MRFSNARIPSGFAWSTPFAKWQGPLANLNSLDMAEDVTRIGLFTGCAAGDSAGAGASSPPRFTPRAWQRRPRSPERPDHDR